MGKYADMLGVAPQQPATEAGGGKYARMLGLTPAEPAKPDVGHLEGAIRGFVDTPTFGLSDEIEGVARGVFTDDTIKEGIEKARARHEASPAGAYLGGQVAGAFIPGMGAAGFVAKGAKAAPAVAKAIPGAVKLLTGTTKGARIGRAALVGGVEGAAYGAGSGEGAADRLAGAASGAVIGAPLGAAGGYVAEKLARKLPIAKADDVVDDIPLTEGQRSGDLALLQNEEALRNKGGIGQKIIRRFDEGQAEDIARVADEIVPGADDLAVPAAKFQDAMMEARQAAKQRVSNAYADVRKTQGDLSAEAFTQTGGLFDRLDNAVDGLGLNMEARAAAQPLVDQFKAALGKANQERVTIQALDDLRKSMSSELRTPTAKRAVSAIRDTYDDFLEDAVTTALFQGDDALLNKLKKSRALHRDYMTAFTSKRGGDKPGKIIEAITNADATPVEAVEALLGASKIKMKGAAVAAKRIADVSPEAAEAMRQATWAKLTRTPDGTLKGVQKMVSDINEFARRDPVLAEALVGKANLAQIKKFARRVGKTVTPKAAMNPSHSGWAGFRALDDELSTGGGMAATAMLFNPKIALAILTRNSLRFLKDARTARKAIRQAKQLRAAPSAAQELLPTTGTLQITAGSAPLIQSGERQ